MKRFVVAVAAVGLAVTGCGGGSSSGGGADASTIEKKTPQTTWSPGAAQAAELGKIKLELVGLKNSTTAKAAESRTEQMIALEKLLTSMATDAGADGIGQVACSVMPVQLLTYGEKDYAELIAMTLGAYWTSAVKAVDSGAYTSFAAVKLDEKTSAACPDVRADVLKASGLGSLNELYFGN